MQVAGGVRWTVAHDRLRSRSAAPTTSRSPSTSRARRIGFRATDAVLIEVGALLLGGSTPAPYTLEESLTYSGGPLSYWSQNDALTVRGLVHQVNVRGRLLLPTGLRYRFVGIDGRGPLPLHDLPTDRAARRPSGGSTRPRRELRVHRRASGSSRPAPAFRRAFCGDCGTHVWSESIDPDGGTRSRSTTGPSTGCAESRSPYTSGSPSTCPASTRATTHPRHPGDRPGSSAPSILARDATPRSAS